MKLLFEDDTIVMLYKTENVLPVWAGYYVKVKETGYWYNQNWRWGHVQRIKRVKQVEILNAGLAQLVSASV